MDLKKDECLVNTITYNKTVIEEPTGNVYGGNNHYEVKKS
jgi:hypothetical protein